MAQAYFLIPGLLLDEKAVLSLSENAFENLQKLTAGCAGEVLTQTLAGKGNAFGTHFVWAWKVLTKKPLPFSTAPYRWLLDEGPRLGGEVWRLTLYTENAARYTPTESEVETLARTLAEPLTQTGFTLQRWDTTLFLTRKTPWGFMTREFETLARENLDAKDMIENVEGASTQSALDALTLLNAALKEKFPTLSLWIDGGGKIRDFYPPTLVRTVLADDTAILGWAQAAGILNHRTGKATGAQVWPSDAPPGASLAVLDNLWLPYLHRDWVTWEKELSALVATVETLKKTAQTRGCDEMLIVACGKTTTRTLTGKLTNPKSLLARFSRLKAIDPKTWLTEDAL